MATDKRKQDLFNKAIEIAETETVPFLEWLIDKLPISKTTFYKYYPLDSEEYNMILDAVDGNKIKRKTKIFNSWVDGTNVTGQTIAYKLMATPEELAIINNYNKFDNTPVDVVKLLEAVRGLNKLGDDV